MEVDGRIKAYKFVAYSAVTFSVVAVLSVCVTLPMVYNYVHHVRRQMHHEMSFCKGSAKDIWSEVNHLKTVPENMANNRTRRQADSYGAAPVVNPTPNSQCDGCCLPGPPGPSGQLASPVRTASPVLLVFLATPESHQLPLANQSPHRRASLAHKDLPAHPAHQDLLATQDHQAMLASPEPMHHPANPARRDPPDHQERPDHQDQPATPDPQQSASQPPQESPEKPEMLDHPAQPAHLESPERTDSPAQPAPRDHPVPMDHQAPMDSPDPPAHLVLPDHRARRVSAPSTAPSTAVSSSRTEQDDKELQPPALQSTPYALFDQLCLAFIVVHVAVFRSRFTFCTGAF